MRRYQPLRSTPFILKDGKSENKTMQDASARAIQRLLHPWTEQSWHERRLLPCHSLYLGE